MNAPPAPRPAPAGVRRAPLVPRIRLLRIGWRVAPHLALCALAVAAAWALDAPTAVRTQVLGACAFVAGWSLVRALVLEALSPQRPGLRLVRLSDGQAVRVEAAARALLWILLMTEAGAWLLHASGSNPSFAAILRMVRNAALVLFGAAAVLFGARSPPCARARARAPSATSPGGDAGPVPPRDSRRPRPRRDARTRLPPALRVDPAQPRVDGGPGARGGPRGAGAADRAAQHDEPRTGGRPLGRASSRAPRP